ncbi:hypothetical protein [Stenotrophomonas rhizophila]|uniref:hypothetical protein n=1 Tax=Stenotrophomonas rhizophila TaxID=216778 RepID=UPI001E2947A4|nr:hypothetical protein [Stenotrophomonas rhizophila]
MVVDAAGGTAPACSMLSCERQRDGNRSDTVPTLMNLFIETDATAGIQFSCDCTG